MVKMNIFMADQTIYILGHNINSVDWVINNVNSKAAVNQCALDKALYK